MTGLETRILPLNHTEEAGDSVLYVMSRDQRVQDNFALLAAQKHAMQKKLPLAVVFCLQNSTGVRAREHYEFMLSGLLELEANLEAYNIPFMMLIGDYVERLNATFYHLKPDAVFFDMNPLRGLREVQKQVAQSTTAKVFVVDAHNVVPVWQASNKCEYAARTIRPKIHKLLHEYVVEPPKITKHPHAWSGPVIKLNKLQPQINEVLQKQKQNNVPALYASGEAAAKRVLHDFITNKLNNYAQNRNDPTKNGLSELSPYLHFGQISSLRVVLEVQAALTAPNQVSVDVLIEEIVVRKELSDNWCYYNPHYDLLKGAPQWAQNTLLKHANDARDFVYTIEQFEQAKTHDTAWNAAQKQLTKTGKMHGYMRMYWAKKVLEWSPNVQDAIKTLNYLNDFYSLDGGDPNGYAGIMWSVAGVHDRPWGERPVTGTIRSMVYTGLKRKFPIAAYEQKWL